MRIRLAETQLGLRNSTVRIPFRYGKACLTRCPQTVLRVTIETGGRVQHGYAGDCLPPSWFDKSPAKDFAAQIDDMLAVIKLAEKTFAEELATETSFFQAWLIAHERVSSRCAEWQLTPLLASFGVSMVERAMLDAMCRATSMSFADAVRSNLFGIIAGDVHGGLADLSPADWLPKHPVESIYVRHTVGLGDPLTSAEIAANDRLDDGFPQALEEYVERTGLCYFKIKVSNQHDADLDRLRTIAAIVERHRGDDYGVTLDGNEQYKQAADFDGLVDAIRGDDRLATFWKNVIAIEQPLERSIALDADHTSGIHRLSESKPVIIDESDGAIDSYARAIELGYRGVSSKNCKGTIKSLLNAGLTWVANERGASDRFLMTGEDLCSVGVVPVQADLCLVATLGLAHIERNGHHYHPGLSYLPEDDRRAALTAHGDLYAEQHGRIAPRLVDGRFDIRSLQCVGFGFAVEPDMDSMQSPDEWEFASLGL